MRENIAYGKPEAGIEEIADADRAAQAHDFIIKLSNGYDMVLTEGGMSLSAGERQRISPSRTILKDAPIFVFDEPATGLDAETESRLNETQDRLIKEKTTFIIAHRFSTVMRADLILMTEEGRIIERGTHEQLLAVSNRYRQIYELQMLEPCEKSD